MGFVQIFGVILVVSLAIVYSQDSSQASAATPQSAVVESGMQASEPGNAATAATPTDAPPVRVMIPQRLESQLSLTTTGSVQVRNYVALTPQVAGAVVEVSESMRAGGEFAAGEVLFRIDPRDFQLALDQANAEVAAVRTQLMLREAEGEAARGNYALLHGDKPVPMLVAKVPQIEQSKADLASAEARAARAALDLSRTEFSLPFAGRVTETSVGLGQMLAKGQAVGQVFAIEALEVAVPIAQDDLARIYPVEGRSATIRVAGREFPAIVDRASAELDQRTRFAKLFLALDDSIELPPGTFVDVTLMGPQVANTYVLPEATEQAASRLWLVANGKLKRHEPVIVSRSERGLIVEAFDYGQGVVLGSVPGARQDMAVTPTGMGFDVAGAAE
jgi:RND family efflux transporter MFP subunit